MEASNERPRPARGPAARAARVGLGPCDRGRARPAGDGAPALAHRRPRAARARRGRAAAHPLDRAGPCVPVPAAKDGEDVKDDLIRFSAGLSLAALAAITGVVSYLHALSVVHMTGSEGDVAYLIPFVADFMILTSSLALLDAIRHGARKPPLSVVSLAVGIGSTVAFNVVAGLIHGAGGAMVASLPPVAFVLSLETLDRKITRLNSSRLVISYAV